MARAECPECHGSGWTTIEKDGGRLAVRCPCAVEDRDERVLRRARIPERYRHCDFENFEFDNEYDGVSPANLAAYHRSLSQVRMVVEAFAKEFPAGTDRGLLLMGPCGAGKTHLAVAALKEIIRRGHSALFYDYSELLKEIQTSYSPENKATEMSVLEPVLRCELLLLDDLGSNKPSPWAMEIVGHILNTRYNDKRSTLITTNYLDPEFRRLKTDRTRDQVSGPPGKNDPPLDPSRSASVVKLPSGEMVSVQKEDALEDRVGNRIRSRLYEMCRTVVIWAPDYRKEVRDASRLRS